MKAPNRTDIYALVFALLTSSSQLVAQTPATPPKSVTVPKATGQKAPSAQPDRRRPTTVSTDGPLIVETTATAPQVVTLLHRLSGLKLFRILLRSGYGKAIDRLDDDFRINGEVHTNVIAGLTLDDGETVVAWLPEVEAEIGLALPPPPPETRASTFGPGGVAGVQPLPSSSVPPGTAIQRIPAWHESPDITVIARDYRRLTARYVGLDGFTGVSVLKLAQSKLPGLTTVNDAKEGSIAVGQRVHLFSPGPVAEQNAESSGALYVRLGEMFGEISKVIQAPSGHIARLEITSPKVSTANIGGVALNAAGETLGIVDSVKGTEATILPAAIIRSAAKRVLNRQASVPRPWLGVRGESLGAFSLDQMTRNGWQPELFAKSLAEAGRGLLVTSVTPGSPASKAALTPGDLILRVNEAEVRTADDFSWLLQAAGPDGLLRFTVARPGKSFPENIQVRLAESPDPFFGWSTATAPQAPIAPSAPVAPLPSSPPTPASLPARYLLAETLLSKGLETVTLRPRVASRLGSSGGLLVVYVEPATVAFKSGLRPGDVIESIDGLSLTAEVEAVKLLSKPGMTYSYSVIRNKQKLMLTVTNATK